MCVFCKIIKGEVPSYRVYEDDYTLAFLDINPITPGHILVVPKKHYENMEEIPEEELKHLMSTVKKIGLMLKDNLQVEGYNVCENNGPIAGQEVSHIHFHIIPRSVDDGLVSWTKKTYKDKELKKMLLKIIDKK